MKTKKESLYLKLLEKHKAFGLPYELLARWSILNASPNMCIIYWHLRFCLRIATIYSITIAVISFMLASQNNATPAAVSLTLASVVTVYAGLLAILIILMLMGERQMKQFASDIEALSTTFGGLPIEKILTLDPSSLFDLTDLRIKLLCTKIVELQAQGDACGMKQAIQPMRDYVQKMQRSAEKFTYVSTIENYYEHAQRLYEKSREDSGSIESVTS